MLVAYLASKPTGATEVYLIVAAVLFGVGAVTAGWERQLWRALIAVGLIAVVLAFLIA